MKHSKDKVPEKFFMEGVSEQSIVGISAGLALEGYQPFVNTIATFLTRRSFEQIVIDLCLHDLPVKLVGNGGGLVYAIRTNTSSNRGYIDIKSFTQYNYISTMRC